MKNTACVWCDSLMEVPDDYDDLHHKGVCSQGCADAETLFCLYFSDDEQNRRTHYADLTEGK